MNLFDGGGWIRGVTTSLSIYPYFHVVIRPYYRFAFKTIPGWDDAPVGTEKRYARFPGVRFLQPRNEDMFVSELLLEDECFSWSGRKALVVLRRVAVLEGKATWKDLTKNWSVCAHVCAKILIPRDTNKYTYALIQDAFLPRQLRGGRFCGLARHADEHTKSLH